MNDTRPIDPFTDDNPDTPPRHILTFDSGGLAGLSHQHGDVVGYTEDECDRFDIALDAFTAGMVPLDDIDGQYWAGVDDDGNLAIGGRVR